MNINNFDYMFKPKLTIGLMVGLLLICLLIFGKSFSKLVVFEGLFLYDLLLLTVGGIVLLFGGVKFKLRVLLIPFLFSIFYFLFSVYKYNGTEYFPLTIRQYAIFIYGGVAYLIANHFFSSHNKVEKAIKFIILFSKLSMFFQLLFLLFVLTSGYSNNEAIVGHNYISPIAILGLITFSGYALVFPETRNKKILYFTLSLAVSFSFGHASAFLAIFIVLLFYVFLKINIRQRVFGLGLVLALCSLLFVFPQFRDGNVSWRVAYWNEVLNSVLINKKGIIGHGFGEPYVSLDFGKKVYEEYRSNVLYNTLKPYSRWKVPPHSSFLTIIFHIGFIPSIFLFFPIRKLAWFSFKRIEHSKELKFLMLSMIGLLVWVSFNVILELPHSSLYFWVVFFTLSYYFFYNLEGQHNE